MNENKLAVFANPDFGEVRTLEINGEPWFVGKDIAEALGYSNARDALTKHVDEEDKADVAIHDGSQNRNMNIINESGLYSLITLGVMSDEDSETGKPTARFVFPLPTLRV